MFNFPHYVFQHSSIPKRPQFIHDHFVTGQTDEPQTHFNMCLDLRFLVTVMFAQGPNIFCSRVNPQVWLLCSNYELLTALIIWARAEAQYSYGLCYWLGLDIDEGPKGIVPPKKFYCDRKRILGQSFECGFDVWVLILLLNKTVLHIIWAKIEARFMSQMIPIKYQSF